MTVKVAGMWELGWLAPITEFDLWTFPLRVFGVDEWCMSPVSGIDKPRVTEFESIGDVILANPELSVVFLDEKGDVPLSGFEHPEDVLYITGRANYSPLRSIGAEHRHVSVCIETLAGKGLLWPHQAIAIVLYDRVSKA